MVQTIVVRTQSHIRKVWRMKYREGLHDMFVNDNLVQIVGLYHPLNTNPENNLMKGL